MRLAIALGAIAITAILVVVGLRWGIETAPDDAQHASDQAMVDLAALADQAMVDVVLPASLSAAERQGAEIFAANCQACHGIDAAGSNSGPPLVHKIYEPSHHGDASFILAVEGGVRAHHWNFGDMPPQEHVSRAEVGAIVSYVRALQRANGIN